MGRADTTTAEKKIDLHGLPEREAIAKFIRDYNAYVREGGRDPIHVVHGYGSSSGKGGVIQRALRVFLATHRAKLEGVIEGEVLGNPGFTVVYPKRLLPPST